MAVPPLSGSEESTERATGRNDGSEFLRVRFAPSPGDEAEGNGSTESISTPWGPEAGMKVGILGSGDVAQSLGKGFAKHGHDVMIGSRDPRSAKLEKWKEEVGAKASTGSSADAAKFGEIVVLATLGAGTAAALDAAGPKNLEGKVVVDVSNPLDFSKGMPPGLFVGTTDSLAEQTQRKLPSAKVVKCFNTVSHVQMVDPRAKGGKPKMLVAGDDAAAKKKVDEFLKGLGWGGTIDCGGLDGARWLEALVPLWVRVAGELKSWDVIFQPVLP